MKSINERIGDLETGFGDLRIALEALRNVFEGLPSKGMDVRYEVPKVNVRSIYRVSTMPLVVDMPDGRVVDVRRKPKSAKRVLHARYISALRRLGPIARAEAMRRAAEYGKAAGLEFALDARTSLGGAS